MFDLLIIDLDYILSSGEFKLILLLFGAFWAYHEFSTRENKAGLSVQFKEINHTVGHKGEFNINIVVNIKNVGNRQLSLILKDTCLKIYQIKNDKNGSLKSELHLLNKYVGRSSHLSSNVQMRIRPNVDNNFSYLTKVEKTGNYLIEFVIKSDLDKYRSHLSLFIAKVFRQPTKIVNMLLKLFRLKKRIDFRDVRFVTWTEKTFYIIND